MSDESGASEVDGLRDLFDNAPCGYLVLDGDGRIRRVNRTLAAWLEYKPDDLRGRRLHEILSVGAQMLFESHLAPLLALNGFYDEVSLDLVKKSPGQRLPVMANAVVMHTDGHPSSTRMAFIRATERRRYERDLIEARAAADAARKELEQSLAAEKEVARFREQFVAVLGHDLRNPLAAIDSGLNVLLRGMPDAQVRTVIGSMQASTLRMRGLIDNVLDFARARLGKGLTVEVGPAKPVGALVEHVVQELRWAHPERDIRLDVNGATPVPIDHVRLAQMLSNLLSNALTHGDRSQPVRVVVATSPAQFELSVSNAGEPIPEAALVNLFQPFFRAAASGSQGLGLGLFIAAEIARAHGGSLVVESTTEETRFTFRMALESCPGS